MLVGIRCLNIKLIKLTQLHHLGRAQHHPALISMLHQDLEHCDLSVYSNLAYKLCKAVKFIVHSQGQDDFAYPLGGFSLTSAIPNIQATASLYAAALQNTDQNTCLAWTSLRGYRSSFSSVHNDSKCLVGMAKRRVHGNEPLQPLLDLLVEQVCQPEKLYR